jgi:hypothetical protein
VNSPAWRQLHGPKENEITDEKNSKDVGWLLLIMRQEPIDVNPHRDKEENKSAYPGQQMSRS